MHMKKYTNTVTCPTDSKVCKRSCSAIYNRTKKCPERINLQKLDSLTFASIILNVY